jgi:hypothetical protein
MIGLRNVCGVGPSNTVHFGRVRWLPLSTFCLILTNHSTHFPRGWDQPVWHEPAFSVSSGGSAPTSDNVKTLQMTGLTESKGSYPAPSDGRNLQQQLHAERARERKKLSLSIFCVSVCEVGVEGSGTSMP